MPGTIEKVTAFITRPGRRGDDPLLFEHPYAGYHIPAGTVEAGENHQAAALREAREETGLTELAVHRYLGAIDEVLVNELAVLGPAIVYARPDTGSFDWASLRRGIRVQLERTAGDFCQVTYREYDQVPDSNYVTYCITGWVQRDALADASRRHFYHLVCGEATPERWVVAIDCHRFTLFWAQLDELPAVIPPKDSWLAWLEPVYPDLTLGRR